MTSTPSNASDGHLQCPQGFTQLDTLCPSSVEGTWPQCSGVILTAAHVISATYPSCFDPISIILDAIQNLTSNGTEVGETLWSLNFDDDLLTQSITVPINTEANIRDAIERHVAFSWTDEVSAYKCSDFFEFALTCSPSTEYNETASLSSRNCSDDWFSGSQNQFEAVQLNGFDYIFFNGAYITPIWWESKTMFQTSYTPGTIHNTYRKHQAIGLCGKKDPLINCAGLLTEAEYSIATDDNSTIVFQDSIVFQEGHYTLLSNDSVEVCWTYGILSSIELEEPETSKIVNIQLIYSHVVFGISTLCLLLTMATYCAFPELRNFQGCSILSFIASLLVSQVSLQYVAPFVYGRVALCETVAIIAHFSFLSTFAWMTLLAVDLSRSFRGVHARPRHDPANRIKRFARYSLFGWGLPLLIVIVCLGLHFSENDVIPLRYGSGRNCWLYPVLANIIFFISLIVISLVANIVLFVITVVNIYKTTKMTQVALRTDRTYKNASAELLIYLKVILILNIPTSDFV